MKQLLISICLIGISFSIQAQSDTNKTETFLRHRLTGVIGHAIQPTAFQDGSKKTLIMASLGLDYDYKFSPKWAIGLHSDIIMQNFDVEEAESFDGNKSNVLHRKNPLALCAVGIYKPFEHISFLVGTGAEISKGKDLFIVRAGFEYGYEIMEKYEVSFSANYDMKVDAYSTFVLGLGVSRLF